MEISWLKDFVSLAKTGNFSRSAKQRHVTQPAFSRRIRALENWAGVALFDRSQQPVKLTEKGQAFLDKAEMIVHTLRLEREKFHATDNPDSTSISIMAEHAVAQSFLPDWISQAQNAFPETRLLTHSGDQQQCNNSLQNKHCDLMLCYSGSRIDDEAENVFGPHIESQTIAYDSLVPVLSKRLNLLQFNDDKQNKSSALPYLAYGPDTLFGKLTRARQPGKTETLQLQLRCEHDSPFILLNLVKKGFGMAWLPSSLIKDALKSGELVQLPSGMGDLCFPIEIIAFRSTHEISPLLELVWAFLFTEAKDKVVGFD